MAEELAGLRATVGQLSGTLDSLTKKVESMKRELDEKECLVVEYCNRLEVILLSVSVFFYFSAIVISYVLVFLSSVSYLSHNRLFLDFYFSLFQFHLKHF